jgi:hypothetical protein
VLSYWRAKVVVEARPTSLARTLAMMILGLIAVLGTLCWLLFNLAVFALPTFAGAAVGLFAYRTGADPIAAFVLGLIVGGAAYGLGQRLFAAACTASARNLIALVYAAPAAFAGYQITYGLTGMGESTEFWRLVLSVIGGGVVAFTAWSRTAALSCPADTGGTARHAA